VNLLVKWRATFGSVATQGVLAASGGAAIDGTGRTGQLVAQPAEASPLGFLTKVVCLPAIRALRTMERGSEGKPRRYRAAAEPQSELASSLLRVSPDLRVVHYLWLCPPAARRTVFRLALARPRVNPGS
jgi:hypothetical protein